MRVTAIPAAGAVACRRRPPLWDSRLWAEASPALAPAQTSFFDGGRLPAGRHDYVQGCSIDFLATEEAADLVRAPLAETRSLSFAALHLDRGDLVKELTKLPAKGWLDLTSAGRPLELLAHDPFSATVGVLRVPQLPVLPAPVEVRFRLHGVMLSGITG